MSKSRAGFFDSSNKAKFGLLASLITVGCLTISLFALFINVQSDRAAFFTLPTNEVVHTSQTTDQAPSQELETTETAPAMPSPTPVTPTPTLVQTIPVTPSPVPYSEGPITIGRSVAGRPIQVYRFGTGPVVRLIVAGIHGGNEWNTIVLADQLISHLYVHPELIPADITLYILRNLNPDGEARKHGVDGRVNDHGVDLNRNWPAFWAKDWDRSNCWHYRKVSGGPYPASEPETQALIKFVETYPIDALISYHSAALGIFSGGQPSHPLSISLAKAVAKVSTYQYPPMDIGCNYTGNLTDWASSIKDIPAIDIELTNHRDSDFEQNLKILNVFLNWKR